ncbi:DUF4025 domain-containing protein [Virgibacillus senegalensis]|uniref:DUF4025 domain-containing protein n=1 Tax=Virgibacillus senegalensis TaxID=1499679 RepID=UPI00069D0DCD|nr:DUF4025 domain-containing protein [Virgibacillus senegalensis]
MADKDNVTNNQSKELSEKNYQAEKSNETDVEKGLDKTHKQVEGGLTDGTIDRSEEKDNKEKNK